MAGYTLLYYSIFRSDGFELDSGFMDTADTVRFMLSEFKKRVDAYIAHPSDEEHGSWDFGDPIACPYCRAIQRIIGGTS